MKILRLVITLFYIQVSYSQTTIETFQQKENDLLPLAKAIQQDTIEKNRANAVVKFIPALVEILKNSGSYNYPFDSLKKYVSIINAPDNAFRIFTWQLLRDKGSYRYYGAIQKNNLEKLELFPLLDFSDSLLAKENFRLDTAVLTSKTWLGALYYNILHKKVKGNNYYFLFGFDGNDLWSNKKVMEVLWFKNNEPKFGAPFIQSPKKDKYLNRFIIQYRKDAAVSLNYNAAEKMIIADHLIAPEQRLEDLQFTFMPDGSYSGYKWKKGKWQYVEKIKVDVIGEFDKPPLPKPVNFDKEKKQMKK